jgi:hypothetical protein
MKYSLRLSTKEVLLRMYFHQLPLPGQPALEQIPRPLRLHLHLRHPLEQAPRVNPHPTALSLAKHTDRTDPGSSCKPQPGPRRSCGHALHRHSNSGTECTEGRYDVCMFMNRQRLGSPLKECMGGIGLIKCDHEESSVVEPVVGVSGDFADLAHAFEEILCQYNEETVHQLIYKLPSKYY